MTGEEVSAGKGLEDCLNDKSFLDSDFGKFPNQQRRAVNYKIEKESRFYRWACNCVWAGCIAGPVFTMANLFILNKYSYQNNIGEGEDVIPFILGSFLEGAVISGTAYNICRHNKRIHPKVSHTYQQTKKFAIQELNATQQNIRKLGKAFSSVYHCFF